MDTTEINTLTFYTRTSACVASRFVFERPTIAHPSYDPSILPRLLSSLPIVVWTCIYFLRPHVRDKALTYQRTLIKRFFLQPQAPWRRITRAADASICYTTWSDQRWIENTAAWATTLATFIIIVLQLGSILIEFGGNLFWLTLAILSTLMLPFGVFYYYFFLFFPTMQIQHVQAFFMAFIALVDFSGSFVDARGFIISDALLKRNVFVRTILGLLLYESLLDVFAIGFSMGSVAVLTGPIHGFPRRVFVKQWATLSFIIVFVTLTSLRGRLYSLIVDNVLHSSFRETSTKFYAIAGASTCLLLAMFPSMMTFPSKEVYVLKIVFVAMHVPAAYLVWQQGGEIDYPISALTMPESITNKRFQVWALDAMPALMQLTIATLVLLVVCASAATIQPSSNMVSGPVFIVAVIFIVTAWFLLVKKFPYIRYNEKVVTTFNMLAGLAQIIVLIMCVTGEHDGNDTCILVLGIARIISLGIGRAMDFQHFCIFTIVLSVASLLTAYSASTVFNSLGLTVLQLLIGLESSLTRRSIAVGIQSHTDAQEFVEHALKQKLVGCLDVVDEVLMRHTHELSQEQSELLKKVARACSFGLDYIYYDTLMRRYGRFDEFGGQYRSMTLPQIVQEWQASWADVVNWHEGEDKGAATRYAVKNRWDVVRIMLHKLMGQNLMSFIVAYSLKIDVPGTNNSARMDFVITRKDQHSEKFLRGGFHGIDPIVAKAMHASTTLEKDGYQLRLSFALEHTAVTLQSSPLSPISKRVEVAKTPVPHGLVFGVLDDVKLVRLNVLRYLLQEFDASKDSFAMGETKEEALVGFVERCVKGQPAVDIVLVDQNLDYEDELVLGSSVALELRRRGYLGTIVLHSANERTIAMRGSNEQFGAVDGFLQKQTFERDYVERCMLAAMRMNTEKRDVRMRKSE